MEFFVQFHFQLDCLQKTNQFFPIGIKKDRGDKSDMDKWHVAEENHFRNKFDQFDQPMRIFLEIKKWTLKIINFFHEIQLINFDASLSVEDKIGADYATSKNRNENIDGQGPILGQI